VLSNSVVVVAAVVLIGLVVNDFVVVQMSLIGN